MADTLEQHLRRLRRLRRSARRWVVSAATFTGATAVLVPYSGLGLVDAFWGAAAGGSLAVAAFRASDLKELAAQPLPPPAPVRPLPPVVAALAARVPVARHALEEVRRQSARWPLRGTAAMTPIRRLDRACAALAALAPAVTGPASVTVREADDAEWTLRNLAHRVASVERALNHTDRRAGAHAVLVDQLECGVVAYENLVSAAAGYVAEDGRAAFDPPTAARLTEAADLLRGTTEGLAELRRP